MNADNSTFGKFTCGGVQIVIDDVAALALEAGDKIMEIYNGPDFESKIQDPKSDGSPLTQADLAANKIICDGLTKLYPSIPIVSEENKAIPYSTRKDWTVFWCVDPLDGTKEFIKRNGQFTVNIGLCENGTPVAGVVYCPALEVPVMYKGIVCSPPAVREETSGAGASAGYDSFKAIKAAQFDERDSGLTIVASASHNTPETDAFISKYNNPKKKSMGSSLKLLMVAEGSAHVYPRLAPTSEWDTCAAHAIVLCSGGKVVQAAGGEDCQPGSPVVYNKENPLNPFFIVYGNIKPKVEKKKKKKLGFGGEEEPAPSAMNPQMMVLALLVIALAAYVAMVMKKQ